MSKKFNLFTDSTSVFLLDVSDDWLLFTPWSKKSEKKLTIAHNDVMVCCTKPSHETIFLNLK